MNQNSGWLTRQPSRFRAGATKIVNVRETLRSTPSKLNWLVRADATSAISLSASVGEAQSTDLMSLMSRCAKCPRTNGMFSSHHSEP